MEAAGHEDIRKHVRIYLAVFAALGVLTVFTVLASYLTVSMPLAVVIALIIASVKAFLVAACFMHLMSDRTTIYTILILTALCLIVMLLVPVLTSADMVLSDGVS